MQHKYSECVRLKKNATKINPVKLKSKVKK